MYSCYREIDRAKYCQKQNKTVNAPQASLLLQHSMYKKIQKPRRGGIYEC